ncbi:hypothetical protein AB0F20_10085 [Streptomyces goshikiensis]|uniref:hypothetical protein n=1 Tax=Streptomyces goshikiensis TaxID=1942 RepID=UPI00340783E9
MAQAARNATNKRLEAKRAKAEAEAEARAAAEAALAGAEKATGAGAGPEQTATAVVATFSNAKPDRPVQSEMPNLYAHGRGSGGPMLALADIPDPVDLPDRTEFSEGDKYLADQTERAVEQMEDAWEVAAKAVAGAYARKLWLVRGFTSMEEWGRNMRRPMASTVFYTLLDAWNVKAGLSQMVAAAATRAELVSPRGETSFEFDSNASSSRGETAGRAEVPQLTKKQAAALASAQKKHGNEGLAATLSGVQEATGKTAPPVRALEGASRAVRQLPKGTSPEEVQKVAAEAAKAAAAAPKKFSSVAVTTTAEVADTSVSEATTLIQGHVRRMKEVITTLGSLPAIPQFEHLTEEIIAAREAGDGTAALTALHTEMNELVEILGVMLAAAKMARAEAASGAKFDSDVPAQAAAK